MAVDDFYLTKQRNEILFSITDEREKSLSWKDILLSRNKENGPKALRRLLLGVGIQFMQQFGGVSITSYYLPLILIKTVGLSTSMATLLSACNAVSYFVFACGSVLLLKRWRRRTLMLFSTTGQLGLFLALTVLLWFSEISEKKEDIASASAVSFFLLYIAFALGMLGVPWLYPKEISSPLMRNKSSATATAAHWYTFSSTVKDMVLMK